MGSYDSGGNLCIKGLTKPKEDLMLEQIDAKPSKLNTDIQFYMHFFFFPFKWSNFNT